MTDWLLLTAPLVVASLVLVLGFAGCGLRVSGLDSGEDPADPSATYGDKVAAHPNLVSYWRLGESLGPTAKDSKDGNDGTYVKDVTLGQPGLVAGGSDTAALFDGAAQYVAVPLSASLNPPAFTVEALVSLDGGGGKSRVVVSSRHVDTADEKKFGYVLTAGEGGLWQAFLGDGTPTWQQLDGPAASSEGDVQFLAMTYDGATLRLYVDPEDDAPAKMDATYQPNTQNELRIGAGFNESASPMWFFPGVIDEVAVYDVALEFATIHDHFALATTAPVGA